MKIGRLLPFLMILAVGFFIYLMGWHQSLTLENLKAKRESLLLSVEAAPILAPILYMLLYIAVVTFSIPGAAILSICGGFLFPQPQVTLYVVLSATIGATLLFLAARGAFSEILYKMAGPFLKKMQEGFQENATSYMLFLRLVPLFPFWLVNIAPAFFNVPLFTYVWTTFIGIIPGAFVYTQAGVGLGSILETGGEFSLETIFTRDIKIALTALALFALLPIVIKKIRGKKSHGS